MDKAAIRAKAIVARAALAAQNPNAGDALRDRFLASVPVPPGAAISGYWPMGDEMDIRPLLIALHRRGHAVGLPVIAGKAKPLIFRLWQPEDALVDGGFGTSCPGEGCVEIRPDIVLVPMLAFDDAGYRVGYGGGYYDRTLRKLRDDGKPVLAVGVAFAGQHMPSVPRMEYDEKLDWIVTEASAAPIG